MDIDVKSKPPFDVEQALDLIIAGAAHTSENEAQSKFGLGLLNEYFSKLRSDYRDDPIASKYLDNLFAVIGAAVRGFSVERTRQSRRRQSIEETRREKVDHINRVTSYTSINQKGFLWKLFGGSSFIMFLLKSLTDKVSTNALLLLALACGFIGLDFILSGIRKWRVNKITEGIYGDIDQEFRKSLLKYRDVLRNFLILALKLREEYYPNLRSVDGEKIYDKYPLRCIDFRDLPEDRSGSIDDLNEKLDSIIERHFAFKP